MRINKIFEGTNEINRLITTGWMLKRALQGTLPLLPAIKKVMDEVMAGLRRASPMKAAGGRTRAACQRQEDFAFCSGVASQKFATNSPNSRRSWVRWPTSSARSSHSNRSFFAPKR